MKRAFTASISGLVGINLLLAGCQPAPTSSEAAKTRQSANATSQSSSTDGVITSPSQDIHSGAKSSIPAVSNSDDITKRLEITYARNASYKKDECPKLVEFESIDQVVTREGEQLPSDFCEYYVFLNKGDTLSIQANNDMQANLISPIWFDFKNGSYTAEKFDKYTIRLSYNGVRYHPANFRYNVRLIKNGVKPE